MLLGLLTRRYQCRFLFDVLEIWKPQIYIRSHTFERLIENITEINCSTNTVNYNIHFCSVSLETGCGWFYRQHRHKNKFSLINTCSTCSSKLNLVLFQFSWLFPLNSPFSWNKCLVTTLIISLTVWGRITAVVLQSFLNKPCKMRIMSHFGWCVSSALFIAAPLVLLTINPTAWPNKSLHNYKMWIIQGKRVTQHSPIVALLGGDRKWPNVVVSDWWTEGPEGLLHHEGGSSSQL